MATPTTMLLPRVARSPSTAQYARLQPKPFFKPRFTFESADREKTVNKQWLLKTDPMMPAYPYERNVHFPEANYGLYGTATIQSGNKISKGRNKGKTVRKWYPNVRVEKIRSEVLNKELTIPITARVMRTIRKCGGLDQYLLGEKPARIKELGLLGWKLRWHVMRTPKMQEQYQKERKELGLSGPSPVTESFTQVWADLSRREQLIDQQASDWEKLREKARRFEKHVLEKWERADNVPWEPQELGTLMNQSPRTLELPDRVQLEPTPRILVNWQKSLKESRQSKRLEVV